MLNKFKIILTIVDITEVKPMHVAVCAYSGNNKLEKIEDHMQELMAWLEEHPKYESDGEYFSAQYDAPFVIPFCKKNEIHVPLKPVAFV